MTFTVAVVAAVVVFDVLGDRGKGARVQWYMAFSWISLLDYICCF
jgi:hypothetical protein